MIYIDICQCGHSRDEHGNNFYCDGVAEDQGVNIGCYCHQFKIRTEKWEEQFEYVQPKKSFLNKLKKRFSIIYENIRRII